MHPGVLTIPPLSLYVHFPWCVHKCPYCDFNSHTLKDTLPEEEYVAALIRDLDQDLPRVTGRRIETVFFGGGTPSLFSPASIARVLDEARRRLPFAEATEITLEANPGTVEHGCFSAYKAAGITRLSIGAQSFYAAHLEVLGRIHSSDDTVRVCAAAHAAGLTNFNLDIMYGLPHQTVAQACADVERAMALKPAHISHYQLTLEPNTRFHAQPPPLPDDDSTWTMQQACQSLLLEHGYAQYEISAYARTGRQCQHNLNYWRFGDYLGIGAGAHAKLTTGDIIQRLWKTKHPVAYLRGAGAPAGIGGHTEICGAERGFEFMLNRLRLIEGFSAANFESATGLPFKEVRSTLEQALAEGMIQMTDGQWSPTPRGHAYLNELQARFLPDSPTIVPAIRSIQARG